MGTHEITGENIQSTIDENGIVILDFWASWCRPCVNFAPTFEAASERHPDVHFGKIDTQAEQDLAGALQISSIPTLMVMMLKVEAVSRCQIFLSNSMRA